MSSWMSRFVLFKLHTLRLWNNIFNLHHCGSKKRTLETKLDVVFLLSWNPQSIRGKLSSFILFTSCVFPQVTKGMFGARKKFVEFVEVVDNEFTDESMYYSQPSMFPHRSDKDVSLIPSYLPSKTHFSELVLTAIALFCRYCHLPRHHHLGSCRNLVQVCMVPKVRVWTLIHGSNCFVFLYAIWVIKGINHCLSFFAFHHCRCTWLLCTRHGEQHTSVKPKSHAGHTAGQPHHPYNRNSHHVSPHPSITKQVFVFQLTHLHVVNDMIHLRMNFVVCCYFGRWIPSDLTLCFVCLFLNRGTLPMNRNMLNHSQVGQGIGMSGRTNSMGSSGLGSPNRSSPSIICMPKQQPARQPFTINR